MKDKLKKVFNSKYMPFVLLFFVLFIMHLGMSFFGDDMIFFNAKGSLFKVLIDRYTGWSSRVVIEFFLINFAGISKSNMILWKICDSFIYTLGIYIVLKLVNKKDDVKFNYLGCLLFLLYPYLNMTETGCISTTLNYMWCFGLGMLSFLPLIKKEREENINKFIYVVSILGLIYATNQEQSCAIILGINVLYLLNTYFVKKKKMDKYNLICTIISILSFIFIMVSPGNSKRMAIEIKSWFPQFKHASLLQKLYFGIVPTLNIFFDQRIIIVLFSLLLLIGVFIYSKTNFSKIIGVLNFLSVLCITFGESVLVSMSSSSEFVFTILKSNELFNISNIKQLAVLCFCVFILLSFVYLILVIFKKKLLPTFILLAGIASRVIMGFSPTVFASGNRTALFMYMSIIICMLFILFKLFKDKKINNNIRVSFIGCLLFVAMINYLNCIVAFIK